MKNNILYTTNANIAIRCEEADEYYYYDNDGNFKTIFADVIESDTYEVDEEYDECGHELIKRYAVELCYSPSNDVDDIEEYGLDFEYFNSEEEAQYFIDNTRIIIQD